MANPKHVNTEPPKTYDYRANPGATDPANDIAASALVTVPFYGDGIVTFEANGEPHVAMRRIVENLGIDWGRQSKKLEADARFNCGHMSTVGADGRHREMLSIPVRKLPLWLATINPNKIPDAARRQKVEIYQEESAVALHDYWTKGVAVRGGDDLEMARRADGMLKMLAHKVTDIQKLVALAANFDETVARIVDQRLASDPRRAVLDKVSVRQLLDEEHKVPTKGRRSLQRKVFLRLSAFCLENKIDVYRCAHSGTWLFDRNAASRFVRERCAGLIADHIAKLNGQGVLNLRVVKP